MKPAPVPSSDAIMMEPIMGPFNFGFRECGGGASDGAFGTGFGGNGGRAGD